VAVALFVAEAEAEADGCLVAVALFVAAGFVVAFFVATGFVELPAVDE
jgi:hypothetical protein